MQAAVSPEISAYINQNSRRPIPTNSYVTRLNVKLDKLRFSHVECSKCTDVSVNVAVTNFRVIVEAGV